MSFYSSNIFRSLLCIGFTLFLSNCFPGGIIQKGGFVYHAGFYAEATPIFNNNYEIICVDTEEKKRRQELPPDENQSPGLPIKLIPSKLYKGGCERVGESSVFFLFNLWPVTEPLNPHYAISTAVQELEGDTMIHIRFWHEKHYYSILGNVVVFKVKGDVIRFVDAKESSKEKSKKNLRKKKRRRR